MVDYLLTFPDKETSEQVGVMLGYGTIVDGVPVPTLATPSFGLAVLGEHFIPTGATVSTPLGPIPEMVGDGLWWVMIRALVPLPVPPEAAPFIVWSSDMVDGEGLPVPRPVDNPNIPTTCWA